MQKYPSTEIKDNWGAISEAALQGPISITKRGRPSLIMMSDREYEELKQLYFDDLKCKVREGIEAADRGEISELSIPDIKAEARRRFESGTDGS